MSGGKSPLPPAKSLVDTAPLRETLERVLEADGGVLPGILPFIFPAIDVDGAWYGAAASV
jgi:hypothetical protein